MSTGKILTEVGSCPTRKRLFPSNTRFFPCKMKKYLRTEKSHLRTLYEFADECGCLADQGFAFDKSFSLPVLLHLSRV